MTEGVKPLDKLQFLVDSTKNKDGYIVDMECNHGNGICTCPDFRCRKQSLYEKNHKSVNYGVDGATRCKHINLVLLYLGDIVVSRARQ